MPNHQRYDRNRTVQKKRTRCRSRWRRNVEKRSERGMVSRGCDFLSKAKTVDHREGRASGDDTRRTGKRLCHAQTLASLTWALRRVHRRNRKPRKVNMANDSDKPEGVITSPPATCSTSLPQKIRRLYFRIFKRYRRLEFRAVSYAEGDRLIRASVGKPERDQWVLAIPEEDRNRAIGLVVMLERRERIVM